MANEDRWREERDRYGRDDRGRPGREERGRESRGGTAGWTGESYRREGSEGRMAHGRESSADNHGGDRDRDRDRDRERSGMWGRGDEDRGFRREGGREYSREDYGGTGHGGGFGRDDHGGSQERGRDEDRGREQGRGYGSGQVGGGARHRGDDDFAQEAYGQGFVGNEGRGFSYGSDYGRGGGSGRYGGGGHGGGDHGREGYGNRNQQGADDRGLWDRASDEVASWFGDRDAERRRQEDYRGRGPKGYRRSDDRIREDVNDRLADDAYVDASEVEVAISNGEVTLSGSVDSRDARRRAEDITESVSGVSYVQNNLRIQRAGGDTGGSGSTAASSASGASVTTGEAGATDPYRRDA